MLALSKQVIKVHQFRKLMMVEKTLVVVASCYPCFHYLGITRNLIQKTVEVFKISLRKKLNIGQR